MSEVKLGQLLDASAQRDAIHIAIAPVVASEKLAPGQPIGFVEGSKERVEAVIGPAEKARAIGIVDPFLRTLVLPEERFYMLLMPNTITSLRHEWTHPAFAGARSNLPVPTFDERRAFLAEIALAPDEETPHKIYADWLEEHGEMEEAKKHREWSGAKAAAVKTLTDFGNHVGLSYERVLETAKAYIESGDYIRNGENESYKDADWDAMWKAYEIVSGESVSADQRGWFFSCSC